VRRRLACCKCRRRPPEPVPAFVGRLEPHSDWALGLIAPIKTAALAFWGMLPAIGATTAALLANPITWIVAGIGVAVAGLALVIRKYWDPIAAYVGGVFQGIGSALQPAITSLTTALAPLAPIGQAVASVFGVIADAASGLIGWVGDLLAPVTLTKDEFDSLSASGQSLGTVIGSVLSTAFTALTFPIRAVGTLVGWVMEGFRWLVSFSPLAAMQTAWQPLSGFFGSLWAGVVSGAQLAWQQLTAALSSPNPLQALQSVLGSMLTALRDLPGQFMSLGSAMLQGLAQGVRNAVEQAVRPWVKWPQGCVTASRRCWASTVRRGCLPRWAARCRSAWRKGWRRRPA